MWRTLRPLLSILVAFGLYQGVMAIVRAHVDGRIEENVGERLPAFSLVDTAGKTWTNADVDGKLLVLNFMRSYCVNCVKEEPAMRAFADEVAGDDGVRLLSVMTDRVEEFDPAATAATLAKAAFTHPVLMADPAFVDAWHGATWAHVTPITYFVNPAGEIVGSLRGAQTLESLRAALADARG